MSLTLAPEHHALRPYMDETADGGAWLVQVPAEWWQGGNMETAEAITYSYRADDSGGGDELGVPAVLLAGRRRAG